MRNRSNWVAIMCAAALTLGTCSGPLGDRHARRVTEPLFRPVSAWERDRLSALFSQAWRNQAARVDPFALQQTGYFATPQEAPAGPYVVFREKSERLEGRGYYFLRTGGQKPILLQAPHSHDDLFTGGIVSYLFRQFPFAGAGFNSLSRWAVDDDARYGDLARRTDTVFTGFAETFLANHAGGAVLQIHGFDSEKRGEESFATADVVVSEGTAAPSRRIRGYAACFDRLLPGRTLVYPVDTNELGGTRNATGKIVHERGGYFLHVELSLKLRRRLASDADLAEGFAGCLMAAEVS